MTQSVAEVRKMAFYVVSAPDGNIQVTTVE